MNRCLVGLFLTELDLIDFSLQQALNLQWISLVYFKKKTNHTKLNFLKKLKPKLFNLFFKKSFDIVYLKSAFTDILFFK